MTSARFPRFSTTLDHASAATLALQAQARMQSRADFLRDAVRNEIRVREAGAAAMRAEIDRQTAAAGRLADVLSRGPGATTGLASARVAEIARPASTLTADLLAHAERNRPGKARP